MANVLVFVERRDGEIKRPVLEACATARRLADKLGGNVTAVALGPGASDCGPHLAPYGVDRIFALDADAAALYAPELYGATVAAAAKEADAGIVLLVATSMGKDLAGRVTARLGTACASDVVEIDCDPDGTLRAKRPVYSGKAFANVSIPRARPAVATLRPNVFPATEADVPGAAEVKPLAPAFDPDRQRARTVRVEKSDQQELDVSEASVIVAGGRGLKEPDNFALIRDLAGALGGAVGASRAVVDAGWIAHAHQVGQTGKVVSPNLYVACGISGAVQHLAGMSSSKVIVAINKDAEAPIFKVADYGIVGDLFEVVPAVTKAVRELG